MANRLLHSETLVFDGVKSLTTEFVPPANPLTYSATLTLIKNGSDLNPIPVHFRAVEGENPSTTDRFMELGDELDVISSEDLRLLRLLPVGGEVCVEVSYFGGGDQV